MMLHSVSITGLELYKKYQKISLHKHFNLDINAEFSNYSTFLEYLDIMLGTQRTRILSEATRYETIQSPREKLRTLFQYLRSHNIAPTTLLDFGCGNGNGMRLFKNIFNTCMVIGVDPNRECISENRDLTIYENISEIPPINFDVLILVHTLHHINPVKQKDVLIGLQKYMDQKSLLFIFEDSWSDIILEPYQGNEFDISFINLSKDEKIELFRANDFWSNFWFYQRKFDVVNTYYKSVEQLQQILFSLGYRILNAGAEGFNHNRVHGVPSGWILAKISN